MPRPVYTVDAAHAGADAFSVAAAAFAASALALQGAKGQGVLAAECLQRARALQKHAGAMQCGYCESIPICAKTYKAEHWEQYMFFGAAWLYRATSEKAYREVRTRSLTARSSSRRRDCEVVDVNSCSQVDQWQRTCCFDRLLHARHLHCA
jgi:Glycosyl hydrolase family 9